MTDRQGVRRARRALDERLAAMNPVAPTPHSGWIRAVRTALGMTQGELAARIGITTQSEARLESNERRGTIRLDSLRRAADALDCDLAYVLVPRAGTLEKAVLTQAADVLERRRVDVDRTMRLEDQGVALSPGARDDLVRLVASDYPLWRDR